MDSKLNPNMLAGLTDKSAKWPDSSTQLPKGPSVKDGATRSDVGENPKTIGPRVA